jgi:hypothetical protein
MRLAAGLAMALLAMAAPARAQIVMPPPEDARDKMAPKEMSYADESEPWWMALADCAAVFRAAPEDTAKFRTFGTAAMAQMAKDRAIPLRDAGAVVMPYIMTGQGNARAAALSGIYGDLTGLRASCDGVMAKHKAL